MRLPMVTVWVVFPPLHCSAALWIFSLTHIYALFFFFYLFLWCYVGGTADMCPTLAVLHPRDG